MKADLYVQGHFWATIDLPGDSLLALLAKGMITHAQAQGQLLQQDLDALANVRCCISLRYKQGTAYEPPPGD